VAHLALTILVVLGTGNHYVVDVAGGAGLTVLTWHAVEGWGTRRRLLQGADLPDQPVPMTG
jgi:hypothetical protein